jgi:hypothetical protein
LQLFLLRLHPRAIDLPGDQAARQLWAQSAGPPPEAVANPSKGKGSVAG